MRHHRFRSVQGLNSLIHELLGENYWETGEVSSHTSSITIGERDRERDIPIGERDRERDIPIGERGVPIGGRETETYQSARDRERHTNRREGERVGKKSTAMIKLILSDMIMAFMWVWAGALNKIVVSRLLGLGLSQADGEVVKGCISVLTMFFFAWLGKATGGGAYNPLTVLSGAVSGGLAAFFFSVCGRIPAQVFGSIIGVKLIKDTFPEVGHGPRLNVDIQWGAMTEGLLTLTIVTISLGLKRTNSSSFFIKTWISSLSKLSLHILGSDLTGGCMNPASAMGWAFARGDHITKEHLFVYWVAPVEAALVAQWVFKLLKQPHEKQKQMEKESKTKSD